MQPGVKVFVGNVPEEASQAELRDLFEAAVPGEVVKVVLKEQYAFVHLRNEAAAERAIQKLNGHLLHYRRVFLEFSRPRPTHTVKIFVGNVSATCTSGELRVLFQEFGPVIECDIVKDYAFVHMEKDEDARTAIEHLNGREIKGKRINVELSNKAHKRGVAGYIGQFGGDEKNKIPTLENMQARNDGVRSGNLAFPMGNPAYSSVDYDYQQRMNNNNLSKFDSNGQARQISPSFFRRDRSPLKQDAPCFVCDLFSKASCMSSTSCFSNVATFKRPGLQLPEVHMSVKLPSLKNNEVFNLFGEAAVGQTRKVPGNAVYTATFLLQDFPS